MGILPFIDKRQTANNVRNFFTKEFPRLVTRSGYSMNQLQSSKLSSMPSSKTVVNNVELAMINHINADEIVKSVVDAINACPTNYSRILRLSYIDELRDVDVLEQVPYERAQFYRMKRKALLYFADSFVDTYDLHAYSK